MTLPMSSQMSHGCRQRSDLRRCDTHQLLSNFHAQLSSALCFVIGRQPPTGQRLDPDNADIIAGIRLGTYSPLKRSLGGDEEHISLLRNLVAGSIAGGVAAAVTNPLDLVKTRLQSKDNPYRTIGQVVSAVMKDEGIIGLWAGTMPSVVGLSCGRAVLPPSTPSHGMTLKTGRTHRSPSYLLSASSTSEGAGGLVQFCDFLTLPGFSPCCGVSASPGSHISAS